MDETKTEVPCLRDFVKDGRASEELWQLSGVMRAFVLEKLDASVAELFTSMLGTDCALMDASGTAGIQMWAAVALGGTFIGQCLTGTSPDEVKRLADRLMGYAAEDDDAMVEDLIGELCNIIAGGLRRRLCSPRHTCTTSLPVRVTSGQSERGMLRIYRAEELTLSVRLELYLTTDWKSGDESRLENWLSDEA